MQCCHLLARPSLALRCLDACGAHEWGTTAYLLERARLHIQICNLHKACSILARLLGQLRRQDFCKEHGEALVRLCAGPGWLAEGLVASAGEPHRAVRCASGVRLPTAGWSGSSDVAVALHTWQTRMQQGWTMTGQQCRSTEQAAPLAHEAT